MAHKVGFTAQGLVDTLSGCGFASALCLRRPAAYDLWAVAAKCRLDEEAMAKLRQRYLPA